MRFSALMMSCEERTPSRELTLNRLRESGWSVEPEVILDDGIGDSKIERIHRTWRRLIRRGAEQRADFLLLLEDDVVFGRHFSENVASWQLLRELAGRPFYASLYNPCHPFLARREQERYLVGDPRFIWGAQALITTPRTARYIDAHWDSAPGNPDQRMPLIAARVTPIYFHLPSLVDHAPVPTTWGGIQHTAWDFDPDWRPGAAGPLAAADRK